MLTLSPDECRALGVLVEKALTVPGQYPLTLNSLTTGCNQKNNRSPVVEFDEERAYDALGKLRAKGLAREVMMSGSRVAKFRHCAREVLAITIEELVVLTELLLRGPQTIGELRGNASRMHPLASLEACQAALDKMMTRAAEAGGPLVRRVPPPAGSRAELFVQLLCPDLHPMPTVATHSLAAVTSAPSHSHPTAPAASPTGPSLLERVTRLEAEVRELREMLRAR